MPTTANGPVADIRPPFFMVPWSYYTAGYSRVLVRCPVPVPGAPELGDGVALTWQFWRRAGLGDSWEVGYVGVAGGIEYSVVAIQWDITPDEQQWICIAFRLLPLFYGNWLAEENWTDYPRAPFTLEGGDGAEYPLVITPLLEWTDIQALYPGATLSEIV